jgi:hypothetical protein
MWWELFIFVLRAPGNCLMLNGPEGVKAYVTQPFHFIIVAHDFPEIITF